MPAAKKPARVSQVTMDIYAAISSYHSLVESALNQLKQPINQTQHAKEMITKDLETTLREWYEAVKLSIKAKTIPNDPSGILTNDTIFTRLDATKKQYTHWVIVQALIEKIISEDKDNTMSKNTAKDVKTVETNTQQTPTVLTDVDASKEVVQQAAAVANQTTITPDVTTTVSPLAQAVTGASGSIVETVALHVATDKNSEFHKPYMENIDKALAELDVNADDADAFTAGKIKLKGLVTEWVDAFYKAILDVEKGEDRLVTIDTVGILSATTVFSSPVYAQKYPDSHLVDKFILRASEKFKKTNTEAPVHNIAESLSAAANPEVKTFETTITNDKGEKETLIVDKETKEITAKKDNIIIAGFKAVYGGFKRFFSNIFNQFKRLGAWIKSWFAGTPDQQRVSPEQAEAMEKQAKADAEAIRQQTAQQVVA